MVNKRLWLLGVGVFLISSVMTYRVTDSKESVGAFSIPAEEFGRICISDVFPSINRGSGRTESEQASAEGESGARQNIVVSNLPGSSMIAAVDSVSGILIIGNAPASVSSINSSSTGTQPTAPASDTAPEQGAETDIPTVSTGSGKPLVIIYHTHATESYQPYSDGNFHRIDKEGTVRELGDVLAAELEKKGIGTIHDTTLHDSPSYNKSYSKSYATVTQLLKQYPSAVFVVDLHRDAAGYSGNVGKTAIVNGETAAKYSLVVGKGNSNYSGLLAYANNINAKAEAMFPGFGGHVIEKKYKYNQGVSDHHILLEIGNNENNIKEARITAKYFADVLAAVIEEAQ